MPPTSTRKSAASHCPSSKPPGLSSQFSSTLTESTLKSHVMGKHGMAEGNHNSPPPGRRGRGGGPNFLTTSSIATTPPLQGTPPPSEEGSRCAVIHESFGLFKVDSIIIIPNGSVLLGTVFADGVTHQCSHHCYPLFDVDRFAPSY